jgi:hypothetical protein
MLAWSNVMDQNDLVILLSTHQNPARILLWRPLPPSSLPPPLWWERRVGKVSRQCINFSLSLYVWAITTCVVGHHNPPSLRCVGAACQLARDGGQWLSSAGERRGGEHTYKHDSSLHHTSHQRKKTTKAMHTRYATERTSTGPLCEVLLMQSHK